eukprot:IDg17786t1
MDKEAIWCFQESDCHTWKTLVNRVNFCINPGGLLNFSRFTERKAAGFTLLRVSRLRHQALEELMKS